MIRLACCAFALIVGVVVHANAQTIGYADAISILARSCESDIDRHCSSASLANWEIGRCLDRNRARISGQCAVDLVRVRESLDARRAAQASAERICANDIRRRCPMTQTGRGRVLRCILKAERSVSAACNRAITNAGWR